MAEALSATERLKVVLPDGLRGRIDGVAEALSATERLKVQDDLVLAPFHFRGRGIERD